MHKLSILRVALLAACMAPATLAQTNTTLLQNWKRTTTARSYSDVWGYTAPNNKEYAVIGDSAGISILDATDPKKVKSLGFYAVTASSYAWRDYTSLGPFIYAVSEHHRGIRVFEIQANGTVKDHGFQQTSTVVSAHNIRSDAETNTLYVLGGNNRGVAIFDANKSRTNPTLVSVWNSNYVHDAYFRHGRGYVCTGGAYVTRILDVRNPKNITQISQCNTSSGYNHSAWTSEDDKILCICHESSRNGNIANMEVWDIADVTKPKYQGTFEAAPSSIVHNVFVLGRTAYMSYYIHGFQMADLTDPTKPVRVASFATSKNTSVGFTGAWGCYPFQDSGVLYMGDMQNGFFSIQIECGHMNRYGAGTAGTVGVPRIRFDGATPRVGASKLRLEVENLEAGKSFWLAVSGKEAAAPFTLLGANVNVDLGTAVILGPLTADAKGKASIAAAIPNNTGLGNAKLHMQVFSVQANGSLSSSRGSWGGICK